MNPIKSAIGAFRDEKGLIRTKVRKARQSIREFYAVWWRRRMTNLKVVAITGSGGKSTTTAMIGKIMTATAPTHLGLGYNDIRPIGRSVITTRKEHKFLVQEVSGGRPGALDDAVKLLRPHVAVVTTIGTDHLRNFRSKEAIAEEKGKLVQYLPRGGLAVLNADDPLVLAMAQRTKERVVTYGRSETADFRLLEYTDRFPERLTLTVTDGKDILTLRTRMVGARWITPILAAIATCRTLGVEWEICQRIIEAHEPIYQRDSVHEIPDGPIFLLDSEKAPFWTFETTLETLANSVAPRKTMVIGTISDYTGSAASKYVRVGREALALSERVVFVGSQSARADRLLKESDGRLWIFDTAEEAAKFLRVDVVPGELIYVKASGTADHMERLMLNWTEPVTCWRQRCGLLTYCRNCEELRAGPQSMTATRKKLKKRSRSAPGHDS